MTAPRFVACALRSSGDRDKLRAIEERKGPMAVIHRSERLIVIGNDIGAKTPLRSGIIFGHIFPKPQSQKTSENLDAYITDIDGRRCFADLLHSCWGSYVAFNDDPASSVEILCSPLSSLPCFMIRAPWGLVLASDPDAIIGLGLYKPSLDLSMVNAQLHFRSLRSAKTALHDLEELLGGFSIDVGERDHVRALWSPWDYTGSRKALSITSAADLVADTVRYCVRCWASKFDNLLLSVSGGLDSSIVTAGLQGTQNTLSCVTLLDGTSASDEWAYARAVVAKCLRSPLYELHYDIDRFNPRSSSCQNAPRPIGSGLAQSVNGARRALAANLNNKAIFNGFGGDSVFCYLTSVLPIVDRIMIDGLKAGLNGTLPHICSLTGCSALEAGLLTARRLFSPYRRRRQIADLSFLASSTRPAVAHHPWLYPPRGQLPGKVAHVATITEMLNGLDAFPREGCPLDIAPLMSQPVVEVCLSVPTWLWCDKGIDRAVARTAFNAELPSDIIARSWKGGPDGLAGELFERNREIFTLLFEDSILVREHIIDGAAVLRRLSDDMPVRAGEHLRILELADAECWARHWSDRSSSNRPPLGDFGEGR